MSKVTDWFKGLFTGWFTRGDGSPALPATGGAPAAVPKDALGTLTLSGLLTFLIGTALNSWAPALAGTLTPVIVQTIGAVLSFVGIYRRKDINSVLGIFQIGDFGKKDIKSLSWWGTVTTVAMPLLAKYVPEGVAYGDFMGALGLMVGAFLTVLGVLRRKDVVSLGPIAVGGISSG